MSLISEALKKSEGSSSNLPTPPTSPRRLWIYRAALGGSIGLVLLGLAQLAARPSAPAKGASAPAVRTEPRTAKTSGMQLLRTARGEMELNGTLSGGNGKSLALINNQIVQQGDQIGGMRVVQVDPDSVQLQDQNGKTKTLRIEN